MIPVLAFLVLVLAAATLGVRLQRHRSLFGAPLRDLAVLFAVMTVVFMGVAVASVTVLLLVSNPLDAGSVSAAVAAVVTLAVTAPVWRRLATRQKL